MAGGFAGPSDLCGAGTNAGPQYYNYDGYDYGDYGDYPLPSDYSPSDYAPIDYSTSKSKRQAADYEDYNTEKVGGGQTTLHNSDQLDYMFYEDDIRGEYDYQESKASLNPVGKKPSLCDDPDVAPNAYTGGLVLDKAFMFNGLAWEELPSMSVRRDRPMCSLIQRDDQVKCGTHK